MARLLQVDVFRGARVLHELLVELLECSPKKQADTQVTGRTPFPPTVFHLEPRAPRAGLGLPGRELLALLSPRGTSCVTLRLKEGPNSQHGRELRDHEACRAGRGTGACSGADTHTHTHGHTPRTLPGLWWIPRTQRRGRQTGGQRGAW